MTDSGQRRLDPETADRLHATYAGDLKNFLIGLLRDGGLADEALQNTFQQTLSKGGDVKTESWKPWLFRVAYNEAMALRRREKIDIKALQEIARSAPRFGLPVDEGVINTEQRQRLRGAIGELPADQQTVVLKRITGDQTFQQIADELAVPLGTVLTRMRLALTKLRAALHEPSYDES